MQKNKKGFTLAELLIVVAIIGILVAISIPIFNKQIEKAREAHDIAIMRQAAAAAVDLYYSDINKKNVDDYGLSWNDSTDKEQINIYGAYDPKNGKFVKKRELLPASSKKYGKGTSTDGGTTFFMGNTNGAYRPDLDYTNAVIVVSIFPYASPAHVDVYWKYNEGKDKNKYVGGNTKPNVPDYSMRLILN